MQIMDELLNLHDLIHLNKSNTTADHVVYINSIFFKYKINNQIRNFF